MRLTIVVADGAYEASYTADLKLLSLLRGGSPLLAAALITVINKLASKVAANKAMGDAMEANET